MQVFKLVKPGFVDRLIAFDSLPEALLKNIRRGSIAGWPRHWREFMGVKKEDANPMPFYILDYTMVNADKEKWQEIASFVKRNVDPSVRLLDKVEGMAFPAAESPYSDLTIEPEDLPIIPIPKTAKTEEAEAPRKRKAKPEESVVV